MHTQPGKKHIYCNRTVLGQYHLPVIIEIQVNTTLHTTPPNLMWKFAENKWQDWNDELGNSLKGINQRNLTPENVYNIFYTALMESCNNFFAPNSATSLRESSKPWWTEECHIATKNARKAFKKWRSTALQDDKTYLNKMKAIKRRTILAAKNSAWEKHIETLDEGNASKFWKFSKAMMNGRKEPSTPH